NAGLLRLLPRIGITSDGPVRSVALFSKVPVDTLDGRTVLLTASSRTAVALLELLCRDVWRVRPRYAQARAEAPDLDALGRLAHLDVLAAEAHRVSGVPTDECREYFAGLDYAFTERHLAGLATFFRRLAAHGLAPASSLRYLEVA